MDNSSEKYALIYEFNNESPLFARVANQYINSNEFQQALVILEKGIFDYPEYPTAYFLYAIALAHCGDKAQAIEMVRKASDLLGTNQSLKFYMDMIENIVPEDADDENSLDHSELMKSDEPLEEDNEMATKEESGIVIDEGKNEYDIENKKNDFVADADEKEIVTSVDENGVFIKEERINNVIDEQENDIVTEEDENGIVIDEVENEVVTEPDENELVIEDEENDDVIEEDENGIIIGDEENGIVIDEIENEVVTEPDENGIIIGDDENEIVIDDDGIILKEEKNEISSEPEENKNDIDDDELGILAEKLNNAVLPKLDDDEDLPVEAADNETTFEGKSLVSETLAKIYFNQGNYSQALSLYETLKEIQPEKKDYYEDMIAQIKNKL